MTFVATTSNSDKAWAPDVTEFAAVDVVPEAAILTTTTIAGTVNGDEPLCRVAFVRDDTASITAEASPIDEAQPELAEVTIPTAKITMLVRVSNEQFAQDQTSSQLSTSVARALVRRADIAYLAEAAPTPPAIAPVAGLANQDNLVDGGTVSESLDELVDLISVLESNLAMPSAIVIDPLGWGELRKLKVATSFNQSLLGAGTNDATPMLLSLPVYINVGCPQYSGYVIDRSSVVSAIGPVRIAVSEHQFFSSDSVLVRGTWRTGFAVTRPERVGRFSITAPGS